MIYTAIMLCDILLILASEELVVTVKDLWQETVVITRIKNGESKKCLIGIT